MNQDVNISSPYIGRGYINYFYGFYKFRFSCATGGSGIRTVNMIGLWTRSILNINIRFENTNKASDSLCSVYDVTHQEELRENWMDISEDGLYVDIKTQSQYASTLFIIITLSYISVRRVPMDEPFPDPV